MANYKIYGVGAALVDTEVRVSDDFLARFCIQKGLMTLVDELRQYELINALTLHECYMLKKSGGSVCNSVVAASSLGAKSFFSGKVASDLDGELFHQDLKDVGVDFKRVKTDAAVTGKCLVMVTDDAERTMNTFLGVSQQLSLEDINYDALCDSEWLYLEGYLATDNVRSELAKNLIKTAKSNGVKTSLSLSDPFVVTTFGDALREIIADGVDLIFCNNAEAIAFTKCSTIEEAIKDLKQYSKRFVVTDGENGAFVFDGQEGIISKGIKTSAIDTNGAGDMFAGAFLYALTSGRSYAWAANLANFCASRVVSQFGPRLGDKDFKAIKTFIDLNS